MHPVSTTRRLLPLLLGALALAGCSPDLKQNSDFQTQVARLSRIDEDLKKTQGMVLNMDSEFQQVSQDMAALKRVGAGGSPEGLQALEQRLLTLEKSLQETREAVASLKQNAGRAATSATSAPSVRLDGAPAKTAPTRVIATGGNDARTAPVAVVGKRSSTRRPAAEAADKPVVPSGAYHKVATGETVEAIAARYKVEPKVILSANRLPDNFRLVAGQTLFVPSAAK